MWLVTDCTWVTVRFKRKIHPVCQILTPEMNWSSINFIVMLVLNIYSGSKEVNRLFFFLLCCFCTTLIVSRTVSASRLIKFHTNECVDGKSGRRVCLRVCWLSSPRCMWLFTFHTTWENFTYQVVHFFFWTLYSWLLKIALLQTTAESMGHASRSC